MTSLRATLLAIAMLAGSTVSTLAADLGDMRDDEPPATRAARFYLRGDLGYDWNRTPSVSSEDTDFSGVSIGNSWSYGGGIGWYITPNWRMDVTAEHRTGASIDGQVATVDFSGEQQFNVSSDVVLANVYYDFSGRAGFNPYIGAGIGWAANHATGGTATDLCGCVTSIESGTQNNFAWALMAGFTRELDRGFSLDVGYRLLNVGGAHTGNVLDSTGAPFASTGGISTSASTGSIYSNEIRVGIRYDIN